jgi:hypothetical protein
MEIGSPGWILTSNQKLDSKSSASDNSATGQSEIGEPPRYCPVFSKLKACCFTVKACGPS